MSNIKVDFTKTDILLQDLKTKQEEITLIHERMNVQADDPDKFLGWLNLPRNYNVETIEKIKKIRDTITRNSDVFIVIGIGGSYLGARSVIDALSHTFLSQLPKEKRKAPEILYVGHNVSSDYLVDLIDYIDDKDISINVISKSGTTLEPSIAFDILKEHIEKKYGKKAAKKRIIVTTDKEKGMLKEQADHYGYESLEIPDNIGGRFSVLTPVGLLPIAVAGIDIDKLLNGAKVASEKYNEILIENNECYQYAILRNELYNRQKDIEIFVNYEPKLHYFMEWLKQLFGESEGKDGKGIFPTAVNNSADLHSLGQYIQDGKRILFETVIDIQNASKDYHILHGTLSGYSLNSVNQTIKKAASLAHYSGGVPNIVLSIKTLNEETLGELIYFFEKACAVSAYLLGVNPFDQPGVEEYKKNIYQLLN